MNSQCLIPEHCYQRHESDRMYIDLRETNRYKNNKK